MKWAEGAKPGSLKKIQAKLGKPPKPAKILANPLITLELRGTHNINGVLYGPGPVKIPASLAQALQEQEQRAIHYDETWRDEKAYLIQPGNRDRKSTRLNSSHRTISYAVFC